MFPAGRVMETAGAVEPEASSILVSDFSVTAPAVRSLDTMKPERLEVSAKEADRVQERLKGLGIKHQLSSRPNAQEGATQATFLLDGPFPCHATLRADYDEPGFMLELLNVRHSGPAKARLAVEELNDDVLDEFGTWILGADDAFERFLERH